MSELTQKILSLDVEVTTKLKEADTASLHVIKKADLQAKHLIEKEQHLFELQKERDTAALEEKLELKRQQSLQALEQKMNAYNRSFDVDVLVKQLLSEAKERVCP
jgi:hypothetical protein